MGQKLHPTGASTACQVLEIEVIQTPPDLTSARSDRTRQIDIVKRQATEHRKTDAGIGIHEQTSDPVSSEWQMSRPQRLAACAVSENICRRGDGDPSSIEPVADEAVAAR